MPGTDPEDAGTPPRRHRGRRRYEAAPAHLQGEPVTGTQAGWVTREIDERTERSGNTGGAERTGRSGRSAAASAPDGDPLLPDTPESESAAAWGEGSGAADDAARAAWYRSQRPPHWG